MRELADLEFAEIGCALDTSPDAVRQAVYEARVSLRQMEAGREMRCDEVVWVISEADGRVVRRRDIRAHLRGCGDCRAFQESIARRRGELRAIAPLPLAASAALVQAALGAGSGGAGGGIAGAAGAGAGKALLGSTVVKTAATCAVVAAIGVTAANRSGLVNVPFGNSGGQAKESAPPSQAPPLPSSAAAKAKRNTTAAETTGGSSSERRTEAGGSTGSRPAGRKGAGEGSSTKANPQQATTASPLETKAHASPGGAKPNKNAAGGGQGHAPGLPSSSAHGQQTATAHKPPQANTSPGTPRGAANDQASPPPPAPPAAEPSPKAEPPAYGKGEESSSRATGKAAPELESSSEIAE
jgi:hypothetical protein